MVNTPIGDRLMINPIIFSITAYAEDTNSRHIRPFSPAAMMEPPRSRAITMTWSILAFTNASHMLDGKIATSVSIKLAEVAFSQTAPSSSTRVGNRPALSKIFARTRPMTQAMAVVHKKYATVFQPTEPTFLISPMERIPSIMDNSTTGTTMNLSRLTKISPNGFR